MKPFHRYLFIVFSVMVIGTLNNLVHANNEYAHAQKEVALAELRDALLNEVRFKTVYNTYSQSIDASIIAELEACFKSAMQKHLELCAQLRAQVASMQEKLANNEQINAPQVAAGLGLCGGATALAALPAWIFTESFKHGIYFTQGFDESDAIGATLVLLALGLGVKGVGIIIKGLQHGPELKKDLTLRMSEADIIDRNIAILNAHYAYAFPDQKKLSDQLSVNNIAI